MIKLLLLLVPVFIYAEDLKSLLEYANQNNNLVVSKKLTKDAKAKEVDARESSFYPTIDVGSSLQSLNERSPFSPGVVYSGYAKVGFDIYDGGRKSSMLEQKISEHKASNFDVEAMKNSITLQIVQDFYTLKSLEASLLSRDDAKKSLMAQLERMQRFYGAKVATKDDVERLQSAYDTNIYEIESIKLQILSVKKSLELKVTKEIGTLENSKFKEFVQSEYELSDGIKSLTATQNSILRTAEAISSSYYPQVRVEDTYSLYGYDKTDALHPEGADNQNKLLLTLNLRVFDNASIEKEKEAVAINAQALGSEIEYKKQEQKLQYEVALSRIKTSKVKITSAKSALVSANSAFELISKKYDAGIVDNIVYLDALNTQTNAKALYETSLNDLEIAYAIYYHYAGKNIEEFLQ
ncbi:TolC family protein [Candidatus Sulfurimonas marisnigri]|uniref:TolC family protein n=1 Tax=Candidatus Sulfurimonas marisnigri TaxID=2740405 RepID=A0A7S7RR51_9BACT|nr:TolC family protein [Candidatus Sulfurimonas marisnigri]QOY55273.1 TolC family protein [Candidatus Sulfurimonas marisnigri]